MLRHVMTLKQVSDVLERAFQQTNAILSDEAEILLRDSQFSVESILTLISDPSPDISRNVPASALYRRRHYCLSEMTFNLPCCIETHRFAGRRQPVLVLGAPRWWQKTFRRSVFREIRIVTSGEGTSISFEALASGQMPRRWHNGSLLITQEQYTAALLATANSGPALSIDTGPHYSSMQESPHSSLSWRDLLSIPSTLLRFCQSIRVKLKR